MKIRLKTGIGCNQFGPWKSEPGWLLLAAIACIAWSGCLELVKRQPNESKPPWWENSGNQTKQEIVQKDTVLSAEKITTEDTTHTSVSDTAIGSPAVTTAEKPGVNTRIKEQSSGVMSPKKKLTGIQISDSGKPILDRKLASLNASRSRSQKNTIKRVNEYALWCIENEMWEEAKSHLEKAQVIDSTSASLSNNLGVVYERLGDREKAEIAYQRARHLKPKREAYRFNLRRLQGRKMREEKIEKGRIDSLEKGMQDLELDTSHIDDREPKGPDGIRGR